MALSDPIPLVRCRLSGREPDGSLRYVPLSEFGLWRHLMETRHRRRVTVEAVSVWVPEEPALWQSGFDGEGLEPILRFRIDVPGPGDSTVPVERFFPAESYPVAQEALLSHYEVEARPGGLTAIPGYFVPPTHALPFALEDLGAA